MNGSPRSLQLSETGIRSVRFFNSSSQSPPVDIFGKPLRKGPNSLAGPRFLLVGLWYLLTARPNTKLPKIIAGVGIFRTLTCGGWTYVTSTDDHDWHDIFMCVHQIKVINEMLMCFRISYLVATLPWTLGCLSLSPPNPQAIQYRKYLAGAFFATLVPLVYFFIQHKVYKVPGGKLSTPSHAIAS